MIVELGITQMSSPLERVVLCEEVCEEVYLWITAHDSAMRAAVNPHLSRARTSIACRDYSQPKCFHSH